MGEGSVLHRVPRSPWWLGLVGVLFVLPTLSAGIVFDDVLVRMRQVNNHPAWGEARWWDLYTFARPELNEGLRSVGFHPWWADPDVTMTFFRPLSSATHVLDYALWPDAPWLHHLHSVLWYGLAVVAVAALLRRLDPERPAVAALAGLLFAVTVGHTAAVGWVAARNMFICVVFGCGVVDLHLRGRIGWAAALLAAGLLAGEATLAAVGIVFAWQLCLGDRRLRPLWPYVIVVVAWRVAYRLAGFGSAATSCYDDPGSDLPGALAGAATHLPSLLAAKWLLVPIDMWASLPTSLHLTVAVGCTVAMLVLGLGFLRLLRRDVHARFYGLAMVLALIPFSLTLPMDRLVLFGSIGAGGLLASAAFSRLVSRPLVIGLLVLHLPVSIAFGLFRGALLGPGMETFTSIVEQAPADAETPQQTFVNLNGTFHREHYLLLMRHTGPGPMPRRSLVLASMFSEVAVTRTGESTLEVAPADGFMAIGLDRIHRRDPHLPVGHVVSLPDAELEVVALTEDGRPARITATFRVPLEDPSLRWLATEICDPEVALKAACTRERVPPGVGETVVLPAVRPFG